jgi:hypothetical protein
VAEIKTERFSYKDSQWVAEWDESQWNSQEWRHYLTSILRDYERDRDKLRTIEPLYEKQTEQIILLERQLELLQKTLDIAEKFAPRLIHFPGDREVIK